MAMEMRPASKSKSFELFDETGKIGDILLGEPDEDGDDDMWVVELWTLTGSGKTWGDVCDTLEEATSLAKELYQDLLVERREAYGPKPGPRVRMINTPMGGQSRR